MQWRDMGSSVPAAVPIRHIHKRIKQLGIWRFVVLALSVPGAALAYLWMLQAMPVPSGQLNLWAIGGGALVLVCFIAAFITTHNALQGYRRTLLISEKIGTAVAAAGYGVKGTAVNQEGEEA